MISSCSFGVFFAACTYELSSNRSLSRWTGDRYSSLQRFSVVDYSFVLSLRGAEEQTKKPSILYSGRRAQNLKYCSRGSTCIRRHLTIATSASMYVSYILLPDYGGIRCSSTLAQSDFFSQLQGLLRDWSTCRLLSKYLLSVRNG